MKKEEIINILNKYKCKSENDMVKFIPIFDEKHIQVGTLRPITKDFEKSIPDCVELFSRWRKENPSLSPAEFEITDERTLKWLNELVVNNDNRMLFLIQGSDKKFVGHIGFASFNDELNMAEVDSVLKGVKDGYPRIMEYALKSLIEWGMNELKLKNIELDVLWDNKRAIKFYEKCKFVKIGQIPLKRVELKNEVKYVHCAENERADKFYTRMKYEG